MQVWLNGTFIARDDARLSAFDAGLQHGVGLFETMLGRNGRVFRADRHVERLLESASALGLTERLRLGPLIEAIEMTVARNTFERSRVRLTVTGGDLNMLQAAGQTPHAPTLLIVAQPATVYPDAFFEQGVHVTIADARASAMDPMAGHKTLWYWPRLRALQLAGSVGAGEALWFTDSNHLASGSVSNVFLVRDGALHTPLVRGDEDAAAANSPVLPGITRATIIELAAEQTIATHRRMLDASDLLTADEVFLTNSSWGVLPVRAVERETIGGGEVGPITQQLREAWLACVERETQA